MYFDLANTDIDSDDKYKMLFNFPTSTIFVSFQHSLAFDPYKLATYRNERNLNNKSIFFHLIHEEPWSINSSDTLNNRFGFEYDIISAYKNWKLVLRCYFYSPFLPFSYYLPLGPAYYGMTDYYGYNASTGKIIGKAVITSSKRSVLCSLKCRFQYDGSSLFHEERSTILKLHANNQFHCIIRVGNLQQLVTESYLREYSTLLANTVFAPCPSGNNPETFRHYEVSVIVIICLEANDTVIVGLQGL